MIYQRLLQAQGHLVKLFFFTDYFQAQWYVIIFQHIIKIFEIQKNKLIKNFILKVPRDPDLLSKWLYDRWIEKETLLDNFYKYGTFLEAHDPHNQGSKIQQDPLRYLVLHLFFITSSYIHYNMLAYVLSYIW